MLIRVNRDYRGIITKDALWANGEQHEVSEAHGQLLINKGVATEVGTFYEEEDPDYIPEEVFAIEDMSDDELQRFADVNGIELGRATKRESIIKRINDYLRDR